MAAIITSCKTIHQFEVKGSYTFNEKTVYTSGVYLLSENGTHIYIPVCLLHDGNQKLHIASECSGLKFKATPFRRFRWDNPHDIVFSNGKLRSVRMRLVMYIPKSEDFSLQEKDAYRELIQYANFSENVTSRYNTDETNEPLMAHVTFRYDETSNALKPIIDNDNAFSKGWIYYDYSWEKSYLDYKGESFLIGKVSLSETL